MTYCLGILLPDGLVLASDSRSNAGVDQVALVKKLAVFEVPGRHVVAVLSAGNLATTQAVVTALRESAGSGAPGQDIHAARSMFDVAQMIGSKLREVMSIGNLTALCRPCPAKASVECGKMEGP